MVIHLYRAICLVRTRRVAMASSLHSACTIVALVHSFGRQPCRGTVGQPRVRGEDGGRAQEPRLCNGRHMYVYLRRAHAVITPRKLLPPRLILVTLPFSTVTPKMEEKSLSNSLSQP